MQSCYYKYQIPTPFINFFSTLFFFLHSSSILFCVYVHQSVAYSLFPVHWKGEEKGAVFSSTCVCLWVNRSCWHEWKTARGWLFGIGFQVPSALLILLQKAKRAINTPSHRGFSRGVMDRISNASVYPRYLSLSLAQAHCVWRTVWEAGSDYL